MKKGKILIVDDMADIRLLLRKILSAKGYDLLEAANGSDALEKLRSNGDIILVLLDIMMPKMDGFNTLEKITEEYSDRNFKVCFLTAKSSHSDVKQAMRRGVDDYIVKPVDRETVLTKVAKMLSDNEIDIKFATVAADLSVKLIGCPIPVDIRIKELSETELKLSSNMELEENSYIEIVSDTLNRLCSLTHPLSCKVNSCTKEGDIYIIKAIFSGLTEEIAERLRSHTTSGKEIKDVE